MYFERYLNDLDTFFMLLQTHFGTKLTERNSLIIFDEVQMFPQARAAIKYLVADGRYDYIETGSLISIRENVKNIVIPSEERNINMYPLDFEEFAIALEEDLLIEYIKKCFEKREPLERSMHDQAMLYENAIAQMLVANGHKLYFYSQYNENKHRNDMEIDFIISNNSRLKYKMFPIEVKSGKQYKTTSLNNFREKYKEHIGESYIIHPRNLIVKDGVICIPPYMTMNI